jgi:hypothetical protein
VETLAEAAATAATSMTFARPEVSPANSGAVGDGGERRNGGGGVGPPTLGLIVDGLDLIGVLVVLADRRARRRSGLPPWSVLTLGTLASIAANVAVAPSNTIARAISGWPAARPTSR